MVCHSPLMMSLGEWPGDLRKDAGIYCLCVNKRLYVGQSRNLKRRIGQYRFSRLHSNLPICSSIAKHGLGNCHVVIIEYCNIEMLDERERFWIDNLGSMVSLGGLNVIYGNSGAIGITEEMRRRMSENHADFSGDKNPFWGKNHTDETRQRMKSSKPSISVWNVRLKGKIVLRFDNNGDIEEYPSARLAGRSAGINPSSMSRICNRGGGHVGNFYWAWK